MSTPTLVALELAFGLTPAAPPVELEWSAPRGCPERAAVLERTGSYLRTSQSDQHVRADASVELHADGYEVALEIEIAGRTQDHRYADPSCDKLADAVALLIAVAIDPLATVTTVQELEAQAEKVDAPTPEPALVPELEATEVETMPIDEPAPRRPAKIVPRGLVRAVGGGGAGVLRTIDPSVGGAAGVILGRWRIEALGSYWFRREFRLADEPDAGMDLTLWTLGARGCFVVEQRVEVPLCAGLEGGQMQATGKGVTNPRTVRHPWLGLHGGAAIAWPFSRFVALWVQLDLGGTVVRPRFDTQQPQGSYEAPPLWARAFLGLEARFP